VVTDEAAADIRDALAGASWDDAHARLDAVEQFESYELEISPGWWFKRMPRDGGRIEIQIADPFSSPAAPSPEATVAD
jgi:hypothetical protein